MPIPPLLPPTFKGKALSFTYAVRLSLSVALPASDDSPPRIGEAGRAWAPWSRGKAGKEGKTARRVVEREMSVPIRVLPRVTGESSGVGSTRGGGGTLYGFVMPC